MMWAQLDFLRMVLEKGYSFIFSDVDVMWFRNLMPHFYPDGDFQMSYDDFLIRRPEEFDQLANYSFSYVKSNRRSIEFYKFWYATLLPRLQLRSRMASASKASP
ncbi:hypothetical protein Cni_G13753 [Canna indica]|uniref:Nucleotide-diphospho-sugar transferase domain-containing protein n=1 Tax=Canna indica TaxID=4628 RepID=A0AAQ3KCM6_9LILI|nr:hypothetical protein Cni_G13753 [Canna indica]